MSFKQFFKEAVSLVYDEIPPKAKFQLNDIVLVHGNLPKKWQQYNNQLGTPVGRRGYSQAIKYAIKMGDGEIILIDSTYVHGPFKDLTAAQKYVNNPAKKIEHKDLKAYAGKDTPFASTPKLEEYMKSYLAPLGYQWLATPKIITEGTTTYTILAQRPINHPLQELRYNKHLVKGVFSFYRTNNSISKKLKSVQTSKLVNIIRGGKKDVYNEKSKHYIQDNGGMCSYFIEAPSPLEGHRDNLIEFSNMFYLKTFGVNSVTTSLNLYKDQITNIFDAYNHVGDVIKNKGTFDDYEILRRLYPITEQNGVKTIHSSIKFHTLKLSNPFILKDFIVEGDFIIESPRSYDKDDDKHSAQYWSSLKDFSFMPRSVHSLDVDLDSFKNVKTTKGIPKVETNISIQSKNILSLEDMPASVNGKLTLNCNKLKSLAGCSNKILGRFMLDGCNTLTSLVGGPEEVGGVYYINRAGKLTSLRGVPKIVNQNSTTKGGDGFECTYTGITSLEGAPEVVYGTFDVSNNPMLKSLKGSPKKIIQGRYEFNSCPAIEALEGITLEVEKPDSWYGTYSSDNTKFTEEDIEKYIKVALLKQGLSKGAAQTFSDLIDEL